MSRDSTGHSKQPLPTIQENALQMDITSQYQNQIDYFLCSHKWRRSIQSAKTRLWADWGLDHELLITKLRLKLKKVGETTKPFISVQSFIRVRLFATPWIAARQASLSITDSRSSLRLNVHQVSDAIQPSHPLSSPSPPAPNPS